MSSGTTASASKVERAVPDGGPVIVTDESGLWTVAVGAAKSVPAEERAEVARRVALCLNLFRDTPTELMELFAAELTGLRRPERET